MEDLLEVLSSLVSDRVRHFELVKVISNSLQGKAYVLVADRGLHLVTCSLSSTLKGGSLRYESIKNITQKSNQITLDLYPDAGIFVKSLDLSTPCKTQLFAKIKVAICSHHMRCTSQEREASSDDDDVHLSAERTLLPFRGYKKVTLSGYFFFVRETFDNTSFTSGSLIRLQDSGRGISLNVNLRDPVPLNAPELAKPHDLYQYSRGFLNEMGMAEVLVDGIYNKRMNLNNDLATWSCYHMLIRTDLSLVAFFIFRRLYMPPMFDTCQDISVRFSVPLSSVEGDGIQMLYNEITTTANSLTAIDQYNMWYKDLIQVRLDNLRFDHPMYAFLMRQGGIVPSYHKLIKGFALSVIRLLPHDCVDPHVIHRLQDPMVLASDDPMDYIYNIKALMFGVGSSEETDNRKELMSRFDMRLADYIAICMDELLMGSHLSLAVLTQYLNVMEDDAYKKKLREVTAYLLHFRPINFSKEYSPLLLDTIIDAYRPEHGGFNWSTVVFNHYATSRMIEQGFFIHQYADDLRNPRSDWNPYINLVSDLLERYNDDTIMERVLKKFLDIPQPIDSSYLPLLKCMITMLRRYKTNYKIVVIVTSILTNFSFHSAMYKDQMIKHGVATVLVENMLSNEDQIVLSTLKLMINITKTPEHQNAFISQGVISNFILLLEVPSHFRIINVSQRYHTRHSEIMGFSAGVLGQLFNSGLMKMTPKQLEYVTEVMLFAYHIGTTDPRYIGMIIFCLKKMPKTGAMYIKVGQHVLRSLRMDLKIYHDEDFVVNVLELMLDLSTRVQNCIAMRQLGLLEALEDVPLNDTLVQLANKVKERIVRRTRCLQAAT
ncbi:ARM repeats containing protein, putative [Babesia ovis]|uniref:ARM repeats containing protein, putative n=1 Tax=Babesia ovis TaxID=5869 RepID=A0A9W5WTC1_BABOV|nr:ARM repeats containing protein, putative [Babesia ovis]